MDEETLAIVQNALDELLYQNIGNATTILVKLLGYDDGADADDAVSE